MAARQPSRLSGMSRPRARNAVIVVGQSYEAHEVLSEKTSHATARQVCDEL